MSKHSSGKHSAHKSESNASTRAPKTREPKTPVSKNALYKTIIVLGVAVILLMLAVLAVYFYSQKAARDEYDALRESVHYEPLPTVEPLPTAEPTAEPEATPEASEEIEIEPVEIPVNIPYLQSLNSDVIGWICVDGTDIDYPILYDNTDNSYYLDHTRTGQYSANGSIFVQDINSRELTDFNTVVYGHNMKDGSMFAQLHRFEEKDFFEDHDTITIYTEDSVLTYKIFAAYVRDNEHLIKYYAYDTEADREAYVDDIYDHDGFFRDDVEVTPDDRIISLSTCTGWTYTRFIVQGVLVSEVPGVCITED